MEIELTKRVGDVIDLGGGVTVRVLDVRWERRGPTAVLGIEAPAAVPVWRSEMVLKYGPLAPHRAGGDDDGPKAA